MKAILTIKTGNKDHKNFVREIEVTPDEYDYLQIAARSINKTGEQYMSVYLKEI